MIVRTAYNVAETFAHEVYKDLKDTQCQQQDH